MRPISILAQTAPVTQSVPAAPQKAEVIRISSESRDSTDDESTDFTTFFGETETADYSETSPVKATAGEAKADAEESPEAVEMDATLPNDPDNRLPPDADASLTEVPEPRSLTVEGKADKLIPAQIDAAAQIDANGMREASPKAADDAHSTPATKKSGARSVEQVIAAFAVDHRMSGQIDQETPQSSVATTYRVPLPRRAAAEPQIAYPAQPIAPGMKTTPEAQGARPVAKTDSTGTQILQGMQPDRSNGLYMPAKALAVNQPPSPHPRIRDGDFARAPDIARAPEFSNIFNKDSSKPMLATVSEIALMPRAGAEVSPASAPELPIEMFAEPGRTSATVSHTALSRPELPVHVARQMAEVMQQQPNRPVELALNPVELGRVRMSITAEDGNIVVHVLAERAETLDLLRRNIGQLGEEFQSLGYESIAFSFGEATADSSDSGQKRGTEPHLSLDLTEPPQSLPSHRDTTAHRGVDIRL